VDFGFVKLRPGVFSSSLWMGVTELEKFCRSGIHSPDLLLRLAPVQIELTWYGEPQDFLESNAREYPSRKKV